MPRKIILRLLSAGLLLAAAGPAWGQASSTPRPLTLPSTRPTPAPLGLPPTRAPLGATPAKANPQPPREVPLVERKFEQLSEQSVSSSGRAALAIDPAKWRHAETDNFIIHYRRATEAQKVVREVEYDLWFVATMLGATRDQYAKKSHVYVFEDASEWAKFLDISDNPMKWAASYAHGDELFLNVRGAGNSGTGSFDSHTLAHETTHAVIARIYKQRFWPLWLNEGFAEYMGGASVAARKGQRGQRYERELNSAGMSPERLAAMTEYPRSEAELSALYQSGEKFVRFLMTEAPRDRFVKFVEAILAKDELQSAVLSVYGDRFKDWASFQKKYEKFTK